MSQTVQIRRFKANPIEIVILSIITSIFFNSLYTLLYEEKGFHLAALVPMSANPISEGRHLASTSSTPLTTWDVNCDKTIEKDLPSSKVRLNGKLCDLNLPYPDEKNVKVKIINSTNQYSATVFTDIENGKFTTDYIPLESGKNIVHLEFNYLNNRTFTQDLNITRN